MTEITWQPAQVVSGSLEEDGWMVLANGKLVAILIHFSDQYADPEMRGKWFVEAGFGPLFGKHEMFSTSEEAEMWIRQHLAAQDGPGPGRRFQA